MAVLDAVNASTLQFVADSLRTMSSNVPALDLTKESNRKRISTVDLFLPNGHKAILNNDGTAMTIAQIATAANLTVAQVTDIAGRI